MHGPSSFARTTLEELSIDSMFQNTDPNTPQSRIQIQEFTRTPNHNNLKSKARLNHQNTRSKKKNTWPCHLFFSEQRAFILLHFLAREFCMLNTLRYKKVWDIMQPRIFRIWNQSELGCLCNETHMFATLLYIKQRQNVCFVGQVPWFDLIEHLLLLLEFHGATNPWQPVLTITFVGPRSFITSAASQ